MPCPYGKARYSLAYISNLLLRTLPAIEYEPDSETEQNSTGPVIIWDLPGPKRDSDDRITQEGQAA
jgi:hypothetical protein